MRISKWPSSERSGADLWGLWISLLLAGATALVLFASLARAQSVPELPELVLEPCVGADALRALELPDGTQGMWFPRSTAVCLLGRVTTLAEAVPYIRLLEGRLRLSDARNVLQERRVSIAGEQAQAAAGALEEAIRARRQAEEDRDVWFRHPAFWFVLGVVATVVLEIVAVWAFGELTGKQGGRSNEKDPLSRQCWEICEVLDMRLLRLDGCVCYCKDVDGAIYPTSLADCPLR